jgi:hypothetical protein
MKDACTEQRFLKDVAEHQMTVIRDDGVHRHIRFRRPDTSCMSFDLVTWPGYLAYSGDMGCYVFTRLPDMFEFFRADRTHGTKDGRRLYINPSYWAEKCVASDRDGVTAYSSDKFRERVRQWLDDGDASVTVREAAEDLIDYNADEGEHVALAAVRDFEHEGFRFDDFWECNLHEYTFRFIWCCYGLAWAIEQYDAAKVPA